MGKPKIFVLHVRQIIKASIFAIIGFLVLLALVYFFSPNNDTIATSDFSLPTIEETGFIPGTYRSKVYLSYRPAFVEVTVDETEIIDITLYPLTQNQELFYPLLTPTMQAISQEILYSQALDFASTYENRATSHMLLLAVYDAITQARGFDDDGYSYNGYNGEYLYS